MKKIIFLFTLLNLSFCLRGSDFELWDLNNNLDQARGNGASTN